MADLNAEQQRYADLLKQANEELQKNGELSFSTQSRLRDQQIAAATGLKNFSQATDVAMGALFSFATAGTQAGKAMLDGKKGATAFNDSINSMTTAVTALGAALSLLIPVIGPLVAGLALITQSVVEYAKASNEMADKLYDGYRGMAESGAAAADGMEGLYKGAQKLNLSMSQLGDYVQVVSANSRELAALGGSVFKGRQMFEKIGEAMQPATEGLMKIGLMPKDIMEGQAGYLRQQTRLGNAQKMTVDQLAAGVTRYLVEQDALTKLTGTSRKEAEKLREEALNEEQYAGMLAQARHSGDKEAINMMEEISNVGNHVNKELAKMVRGAMTGNLAYEGTQKLLTDVPEIFDLLEKVKRKEMTVAELYTKIGRGMEDTSQRFGAASATYMANDKNFVSQSVRNDVVMKTTAEGFQKNLEQIQIDQKNAGAMGGKAQDANLQAAVDLRKKQIDATKASENFVFEGIIPAQEQMAKLATVTKNAADGLHSLFGGFSKILKKLGILDEDKLGDKSQEISDTTKNQKEAEARLLKAKTDAERDYALRDKKFWDEKLTLLNAEKTVLEKEDNNAKLEKQIIDRAKAEKDIAKANHEKTMLTANWQQKMGIGQDTDQKKSAEAYQKALTKYQNLTGEAGGGVVKKEQQMKAEKANFPSSQSMGQINSQEDLAKMGLNIKSGDVQAQGAKISPKLIELARSIQAGVPGFSHFSSFNDKYHQENAPSSQHTQGLAVDFAVNPDPTGDIETGKNITKWLKDMGASVAIDEYNSPSAKSTGGHFHAQIPAFADGGELGAGKIGIAGEAGPELITGPANITPMNELTKAFNGMSGILMQQVNMLDELVRAQKNGNDISNKILRVQT